MSALNNCELTSEINSDIKVLHMYNSTVLSNGKIDRKKVFPMVIPILSKCNTYIKKVLPVFEVPVLSKGNTDIKVSHTNSHGCYI